LLRPLEYHLTIDEVDLTHVRRYEFARQYVSGKSVLDVGGGADGVGAAILAEVAAKELTFPQFFCLMNTYFSRPEFFGQIFYKEPMWKTKVLNLMKQMA